MRPQTYPPLDSWNLTAAQKDTLAVIFREHGQLKQENEKLRKTLKLRELDIAKHKADLESHILRIKYLEEENQSIRTDLAYVERQFISIEKRLQTRETKASAVAALAEVKLAYDRFSKENPGALDPDAIKEIEQKLKKSDELIHKNNYPAAVYYAKRAHRLLELSSRNRSLQSSGEIRIVAANQVNLRKGPGFDREIIGSLSFGTVLVQVSQRDSWSKVRTRDGREGWVHKKLIR